MIIKTVGTHPLTDALQLHAIVDALHSYGLDKEVYVIPKVNHHVIDVSNELSDKVIYALINYVLKVIYEEYLLSNEKVPAELIKAIELTDEAVITSSLPSNELSNLLINLRELITTHFSKHPIILDVSRLKSSSKSLEDVDTSDLINELVGSKVFNAKRVIPILPAIGKFYYVDGKVKSWGSHIFDPVCGRLVRAGLKLALTYPVRVAKDNYELGIALVTPSSKVLANDLWRAQALLRTFRSRWVREGVWGRAHTVFMLLDAFRIAKSLNEEAAGYLVEATFSQTQRPWRRPNDVKEVVGLARVIKDEDSKYFGFIRGIAVTSESVTPTHPALRLAKVFESIGGSIDWLVDGLIHKYYLVRGATGLMINYGFTKYLIKALIDYDLIALYKALRSLSTSGNSLTINHYQLTCLIKAIEILRR